MEFKLSEIGWLAVHGLAKLPGSTGAGILKQGDFLLQDPVLTWYLATNVQAKDVPLLIKNSFHITRSLSRFPGATLEIGFSPLHGCKFWVVSKEMDKVYCKIHLFFACPTWRDWLRLSCFLSWETTSEINSINMLVFHSNGVRKRPATSSPQWLVIIN